MQSDLICVPRLMIADESIAAPNGGYGSSSDRQRGLGSVTQGADAPPAIRQLPNRSGWVIGGLWLPRTPDHAAKATALHR
jgi:hypothetical protein